ncbi:SusC/RagA family TonB-linked outer membrane protein [Chitinophaga cymbidii]|uniref:SusC/RagA family TonB-linked outer membrane protein n=1 Tax=Chitinophaga cymbidii TaxID=1096750 RepID=A0A512RQX3_9BACT|nr:SusC/RagA family TonB-linked outer membrane protein [Chitinophaga cymbidii]GEP98080.1 SusC/RagA family TonB-linked outer membrane protein [Chitinophaga cymbidii]
MKLTTLMLLVTCCMASARSFSQKVSLQVQEVSLKAVIADIKKQTGYTFFYNEEWLEKGNAVTLNLRNADLHTVLDEVFKNQPLRYRLINKTIVLALKSEPAQATVPLPPVKVRVMDATGKPLAGASVLNRSTRKTGITDAEGMCTVEAVAGDVIEVSFIGYATQVVTLPEGRMNTWDILLKQANSKLDEVQVIAYGTTIRRFSTGSIGTLKAADIEKQPVGNPLAALQGRIAGLNISATGGAPGAAIKVQVRGKNSLTNGSDPLFIIDGVPFAPGNENINQHFSLASTGTPSNFATVSPSSVTRGNTTLTAGLSPFQIINPADIESIEVLRDADATAIYGSRGANGVILITTRKGAPGKTVFNAQVYTGASKVTRLWKMMNTQEYVKMRREAFSNANRPLTPADAYDLLIWDTTAYTDWQRLLIGGTAHTTDANARLSGGNERTQFMLGAGFRRETNVFPGEHANVRGSLQTYISNTSRNERFQTQLRINYGATRNESAGSMPGIDLPPNAPSPYDAGGKLNWGPEGARFANPMAGLLKQANMDMENMLANLQLSYKLAKGLVLKTSLGHNSIHTKENNIIPVASLDPLNTQTGSFSLSNSRLKSWLAEPQLEYAFRYRDMKMTALAGGTWQYNNRTSSSVTGRGYTDDAFISMLNAADGLSASNSYVRYKYAAAFGRFTWRWHDRYLLNLSGRRDGSSRFGDGRKFSNFGAVGMGWIFYQEPALKHALRFLSFGKLRGSYGITGSDQIGDYMYLNTWSPAAAKADGLPALMPDALFNDAFNWERNRKLEGSLELGFWNDRVLTTVSYYRNRSNNQLVQYKLPAQTGFAGVIRNFPALIQNSGWEFEINARPLERAFTWNTAANLSLPRNILKSFPGIESSSYNNIYVVGQSINLIRAYVVEGVNPQTGVYTLKDVNRDGTANLLDQQVIGHTDPAFFGGWSNSFAYKGVELDVFLEFKKIFGYNQYYASAYAGDMQNRLASLTDRWQQPGDADAKFQQATAFSSPAFTMASRIRSSDIAYGNNSYMRLKSLMLSYNLPADRLKPAGIKACRIYFQGYNLFTWSSNREGDPEAPISTLGIPPLRTVTAGLNITI